MPYDIVFNDSNNTYCFKEVPGPFPAHYRLGLLKKIKDIFDNNRQYHVQNGTLEGMDPQAFLKQKAQELLTPRTWLDWLISLFYTTAYQEKVQKVYQEIIETPDEKFIRELRALTHPDRYDAFCNFLKNHPLPSKHAIDQITNVLYKSFNDLRSDYNFQWTQADYKSSMSYEIIDRLPTWDKVDNARQFLVYFFKHIGGKENDIVGGNETLTDILKATDSDYKRQTPL